MSIIKMKTKGGWKKTDKFFRKLNDLYENGILDKIATETIALLKANTPRTMDDTKIHVGDSWSYVITKQSGRITITFLNDVIINDVNIAIILDEGHVSSTGTYVAGKHYIQEPIDYAKRRILEELRKD